MKIINIIKKTKKIIKIRIQLHFNKCRVAENPNTPPEVLAKLADDEDWLVRCGVAKNPNTPPEVLEKLANDENFWVRCNVAYNPNTPKYIKTHLRYENYLKCYGQI